MRAKGTFAPGVELVDTRETAAYRGYPSWNLTPDKLSAILRELDSGYCRRAMEFFDEMEEKDVHLSTVMQTRISAVASRARRIVPAGGAADDKKCADFIRDVWEALPGKTAAITGILSAIGKGFSVTEMVFDAVEGRLVASKLNFCPQSLFLFSDIEGGGKIKDFPDSLPFGETRPSALPRDKFIFHVSGSGGMGPLRGGLYRGLSWYFLFTSYSIKDWMSFMDIYGIPMRLGKFKPTADESSRLVLKEAVRSLGSDAAAIISEDTTIEFIESRLSGSHDLFHNAVEFFNRQKSKRVLGQTLTTEQGASGSYALGSVHEKVRSDILYFDCSMLDETLSRDFIIPLVKANFGERKTYPRFVTDLENQEEKGKKLENIITLHKMGLPVSVMQFYEAAGLKRPVENDEVLREKGNRDK